MNFIKKRIKKIRTVFEAHGDDSSRDTFKGELNYEAGKLFSVLLLTLVVWLFYIPVDLELHPHPLFVTVIRAGLTFLCAALISLKFIKRFRDRPGALMLVMVIYFYLGAAIITGTAGQSAATYIGGMNLVLMTATFAPLTFNTKAVCSVVSISLFYLCGVISGMDFSDRSVKYGVTDLMATFTLAMIAGGVLNGIKFRSWSLRQELKGASQAKTDFLAKMSHEIRTPMNAITGMAELALRENVSPPSAREHVATIKQSGANLLSLINDILDVSKVESGRLEIVKADYNFASLVHDVVSIIRMRMIDSPVLFTVEVDGAIPSVMYGDKARVRQIMLNILGNAVKYTRSGRITLSIGGRAAGENAFELRVSVSDTGRGIREEDKERIFERFVQVDTAYNRGVEGTGLGLVISKTLAVAMGGGISVESEYGSGSVFTVTLPQEAYTREVTAAVENPQEKKTLVYDGNEERADRVGGVLRGLGIEFDIAGGVGDMRGKLAAGDYAFLFAEDSLCEEAQAAAAELGGKTQVVRMAGFGSGAVGDEPNVIVMPIYSITAANVLNGMPGAGAYNADGCSVVKFIAPEARVLVVDDIKTNLEVTKGLLSPYEMRVDTCLGGAEAIKLAGSREYDAVLMDHMMPEMNGLEAMKKIRELGGRNITVPVIALTANAVLGIKKMLLENGFDDYLSKPVDTTKLNSILEKWIPWEKQRPMTKKIVPDNVDFSIDGVDVKAGLSRAGGSAAAYFGTLSVFCCDGRERIAEIQKCLEEDDLPLFTINVHALKGAAANVGAMAFSAAAGELEAAGKREDRAVIRNRTGKLLETLEELLRCVEAAVAAQKAKRGAAKFDRETVKATLMNLNKAIDAFDIDGINTAAGELRRLAEFGGEIEAVLHKTLIGDHDAAASLIEEILMKKG